MSSLLGCEWEEVEGLVEKCVGESALCVIAFY